MDIRYKTVKQIIIKLKNLKREIKLNFHQDFGKFDEEMCYLRQNGELCIERDPFRKDAQGRAMIRHEAIRVLKFSRQNHKLELKK